ncbi:Nudix hydrolase 14 [Paramyrothecium foliicola]|nr:Nudix hydrolase 14 [Paramyrothecium foliicola]
MRLSQNADTRLNILRHHLKSQIPIRSFLSVRAMSHFTLQPQGVPVTLPDGLSQGQLQEFKPFTVPYLKSFIKCKLCDPLTFIKNWIGTLTRSLSLQSTESHPFHADPYALRSITVQSFDQFGGDRLGFVKLTASVTNGAGENLPSAALLRGPSVAVLFILVPDDVAPDADERYVVLTVQARIPAGSLGFVELPAGMVDDAGSFKGAAAKEIEEELGITIQENDLKCLSELAVTDGNGESDERLASAMFPSAGGCDEYITLYSHERRIPRSQLREWSGRLTGLRDHGEKITLKVVPMKDLWKEGARDAKCLSALALWEGLRREGKL